jgi:hypothetical protein
MVFSGVGEDDGVEIADSVGASVGAGVWLGVIDAVICGGFSAAVEGVMEEVCSWAGWLPAQAVTSKVKNINKNRDCIPGIIQASARSWEWLAGLPERSLRAIICASSGRGAARLARLHGVQEVLGSNPSAPTGDSAISSMAEFFIFKRA